MNPELEAQLEVTRDQRLWAEALNKAIGFAWGQIEELPTGRFEEIGEELGGHTSYIEDLRALSRITERARGTIRR